MNARTLALSLAATLFAATSEAEYLNVAAGQPVSLAAGAISGGDLATLTDEVLLPRGTQWQTGTVWWNGATTLQIDLDQPYELAAAAVQADDNDAYLLEYRDAADGIWKLLWEAPNYTNRIGGGMISRPDFGFTDTEEWYELPTPVTADAVRASALSGDNNYSLSEIRLGVVPEPSTCLLAATLAIGLTSKRRM